MWPVLMSRVGTALATASPSLLSKVGARIGAAANPKAILAAIKNNKLLAGYTLYELFGSADPDLLNFLQDEKVAGSLQELISSISYAPDEDVSEIEKLNDEFMLIENVSRLLGGVEALMQLRNVLKISDAVFVEHQKLRTMGYRR